MRFGSPMAVTLNPTRLWWRPQQSRLTQPRCPPPPTPPLSKSPLSQEAAAVAVGAVVASPGAEEAVEASLTPTTEGTRITKIVQIHPTVKIKIKVQARSLIRGVPDTAQMSQIMRAAVTGKKVEMRPTAPTPSSAAGCTSLLLAVPRIERLASLTSLKIII